MQQDASNECAFNSLIKKHWGHIVALLVNYLKDIELAEDAMQDALESALIHWRKNGTPANPQAWLFTTAKHKALDEIRRAQNFTVKQKHYLQLLELNSHDVVNEEDFTIPDERLRLIFICCHPALEQKISVALTLKLVAGLTTQEIAKAFLVKTATMAQRLVRGKRKIKRATIPYNIPDDENFSKRLDAVLAVLYLIFNAGYSASSKEITIRQELSNEALRATHILLKLCPQEPEVKGLLALMLIHDSRRQARFDLQGKFVPLESQDRGLWNNKQKEQGIKLLLSALQQKQIGSYQLQATISAVHADAENYRATNWQEIILVYERLLKIKPSYVIQLNQLVAISQVVPVSNVFDKLNELEPVLENYQPFYAVKADFLVKLGKTQSAIESYDKAINLCENLALKEFLINKRADLLCGKIKC